MRRSLAAALLTASMLAGQSVAAAPAHDICADLGPTLPVGVSSFSAAGDWPVVAEKQHGVDWKLLYIYVVPTNDPKPDVEAWLLGKVDVAKSIGAIPVFTFYELLQIGQQKGLSGTEPDVVKGVLGDAAAMRRFFEDFVFVLQTAAKAGVATIVQVEPDSWGFMIWAMGIEGNADATSVPALVKSSGHADVAAFPDHAGGLGQALLALRDQHAPSVRLGWHASNFRVGQKPEVVAGFYSSMGQWDVLFTEEPHLEGDESKWWLPWDPTLLDTNVAWFQEVSSSAGLPIIMWQAQIGTTDFHFFDGDAATLERFAKAGLAGVLFDMRGSGDPDDYRAYEIPALATVPPADSPAGGTAKHMRERLASYAKAPLAWPAESPCAAAGGAGVGGAASGGSPSGGSSAGGTAGSSGARAGPASDDDSGCGCRAVGRREGSRWGGLLLLVLVAAARRFDARGARAVADRSG